MMSLVKLFLLVVSMLLNHWALSLVVPGKGCGVSKPYRKLDLKVISENMTDVDQLECNITPSEDVLGEVLAKVAEVKCMNSDIGSCMHAKDFKFFSGGVDCTPDMVTKLDSIPEDADTLTCALVPDALVAEMKENQSGVSLCLLGNLDCDKVEGHHLVSRSFACEKSVIPTLLTEAPSTWEGVDCKLVPNEVYVQEEDNIRIQWCKEVEDKCSDLPQGYVYISGQECITSVMVELIEVAPSSLPDVFACKILAPGVYAAISDELKIRSCIESESECASLPAGYGYESGYDCGRIKEIELVTTAPPMLEVDFSCKIMTPDVFQALANDLTIKHCAEDSTCGDLQTETLRDKSSWVGYGSSVYQNNHDLWPVSSAYDGQVSSTYQGYYHSNNKLEDFLQIDLSSVYFVTRLVIESRRDCCIDKITYYEARVGLEDASTLPGPTELLFINQVCSPGDDSQVTTKDYTCPKPLKGRYVTIQKTLGLPTDSIYVNEVDVDVVVF